MGFEMPPVVQRSETEAHQEQENKKAQQVSELGSLLHDEWRAGRKKEDGTFEPREKTTTDQEWIQKKGVDTLDIANTSYDDLPEDWKGENKASAVVAVEEAYKALAAGKALDENFIEAASSTLHEKWLERNGSWAPEEQKRPYAELSEEEKEKDRVIVRKAAAIIQG